MHVEITTRSNSPGVTSKYPSNQYYSPLYSMKHMESTIYIHKSNIYIKFNALKCAFHH